MLMCVRSVWPWCSVSCCSSRTTARAGWPWSWYSVARALTTCRQCWRGALHAGWRGGNGRSGRNASTREGTLQSDRDMQRELQHQLAAANNSMHASEPWSVRARSPAPAARVPGSLVRATPRARERLGSRPARRTDRQATTHLWVAGVLLQQQHVLLPRLGRLAQEGEQLRTREAGRKVVALLRQHLRGGAGGSSSTGARGRWRVCRAAEDAVLCCSQRAEPHAPQCSTTRQRRCRRRECTHRHALHLVPAVDGLALEALLLAHLCQLLPQCHVLGRASGMHAGGSSGGGKRQRQRVTATQAVECCALIDAAAPRAASTKQRQRCRLNRM